MRKIVNLKVFRSYFPQLLNQLAVSNFGLLRFRLKWFNLNDLDVCLSLFLWPKVPNCEKTRDLKDPSKFNDDNNDIGISAYIKWVTDSFPKIKDNVAAAEQQKCLILQILALLKTHDPTHLIFDMIKKD